MSGLSPPQALSDLVVLDLTRVRAGPTCCRVFADFGADVIKVETPPGLDPNETMAGPRDGPDFQNLHRNKRSIALNLKVEADRALFLKLVRKADVVVENYRPGVMDRLGLSYEALAAVNPRIILGSVSGFGQDGPGALRPGFDQIAQGMGGLMGVTGFPGGPPLRAGAAVADVSAGLFLAIGVLMAVHERARSGRGQWVQSSLLHAMIAVMDFQAARYLMTGQAPKPAGNDHPTSQPASCYATADGHLNVAAHGEAMWRLFAEAVGRADLVADPEFATEPLRGVHRARLNAALGAALAERPTAHWLEALTVAGVPCGPVYSMDQVFADSQVKHLGAAAEVEHGRLGRLALVAPPVRLSRTPYVFHSASPDADEHRAEIIAFAEEGT